MRIRTQLALWYTGILLAGFLLIFGWAYYEFVIEHPAVAQVLAKEGFTPLDEIGEILLYGGVPAVIVALVGGWFLMRRALGPLTSLTNTLETIHVDTLGCQLPRSGNGDELDRLSEVFNSMMGRLDHSFTRIRDFTISASHELKTPLTILRGEIETRLRDQAVSTADRDFFAAQLDEIARLTKIVDGLSLLARADTGQLVMAREPVRWDELVRDSFEDARLLAQSARVQVELIACDPATVQGDRHRLRQLLLNLAENAIKYNQPDGSIRIALRGGTGSAVLTIANTGPGIPPEKLPRVFDRFYRVDTSHNSAVEGCGLGLSIVQLIVKSHNGAIDIRSTPLDWTTVEVRLPAQPVVPARAASAG